MMRVTGARGAPRGVLVGIDIGLTCTGVAICTNRTFDAQDPTPHVIQRWPGADVYVNKVPTRVAYTAGEIGVHSFGFECPNLEDLEEGMAIKDMFKFCLSSSFLESKEQENPSNFRKFENVKLWYEDFLTALYTHIVDYVQEDLATDLRSTSIEFIFSIPTLWKDDDLLVHVFRELVAKAGFDAAGSVIMELTEGEACAVSTAKLLDHKFEQGEAFMVCDAGGGTTDMSVLQVKRVSEGILELENLMDPKALAVGSVHIDALFQAKAEKQLREFGINQRETTSLGHRITRGDFHRLKIKFGTDLVGLLPVTSLPVPNSDKRVKLDPDELQAMFDEQIQQIINFIDKEIVHLRERRPDIKLSYLLLAGGLGSSKYVQNMMKKHCKELEVSFAPDPKDLPLTVCKGLVIDRLQHFSHSLPVIPIRSSNSSYGILCREIYGKRHSGQGQRYTRNPLDGEKYAEKQIDWLVLENQKSRRGECVRKKYSLVLDAKSTTHEWGFSVVRSTLESDNLPTFLDGKGGAMVICHVMATTQADLHDRISVQRRSLTGKRYISSRVDCELSAIVEAGKMEFTIKIIGGIAGEGQDENGDGTSQKLEVRWEDEPRVARVEINCLIRNL
ncbi:hypothetical protein BDZ45DRAFT_727644 [Acephala macrosclerotiorum]|nr:hypothetical protein BDZ45DRAFT_727644 [Acephala macrosclerotiorum]